MALTFSNIKYDNAGSEKKVSGTIAFDTSYPTGGEEIDSREFGMSMLNRVKLQPEEGYNFEITGLATPSQTCSVEVFTGGLSAHTHASTGLTFAGTSLFAENLIFTDDDAAATNGTLMYAAVKDGKMESCVFASENANGVTALIESQNGPDTYVVYKPIGDHNVDVTDLDAAAATGVVMYAHITDGQKAMLKFVSPTNAMGTFTCNNGGDTVPVIDSDTAADGGVQVYIDEDATDGSRLMVNSPTGLDMYVETTSGRFLKIAHNANPAGVGVLIYFDEDAANSYERLLFVSPTDTSAVNINDSAASWSVVTDETLLLIYFDEDATSGQRLLHAAAAPVNLYVPFVSPASVIATPRLQTIKYSATAAAEGVAVYFDDDAVSTTARILFVSPTDASGSNQMNSNLTLYNDVPAGALAGATASAAATAESEVANATDLNAAGLTAVEFEAYGS